MMICAPLTKSPNWASQHDEGVLVAPPSSRTRSRGRRTPRAASRRSRTCPAGRPGGRAGRTRRRSRSRPAPSGGGRRCPGGESWPARRTVVPSSSSEPKASASARRPVDVAVPSTTCRPPGLELLGQLGVDGEALGHRVDGGEDPRRRSSGVQRRCRRGAARRSAAGRAWPGPRPAPGRASRVSSSASWRRCWKSSRACSASSRVMSPRLTRASVYSLRTERRASIRLYISGWV